MTHFQFSRVGFLRCELGPVYICACLCLRENPTTLHQSDLLITQVSAAYMRFTGGSGYQTHVAHVLFTNIRSQTAPSRFHMFYVEMDVEIPPPPKKKQEFRVSLCSPQPHQQISKNSLLKQSPKPTNCYFRIPIELC